MFGALKIWSESIFVSQTSGSHGQSARVSRVQYKCSHVPRLLTVTDILLVVGLGSSQYSAILVSVDISTVSDLLLSPVISSVSIISRCMVRFSLYGSSGEPSLITAAIWLEESKLCHGGWVRLWSITSIKVSITYFLKFSILVFHRVGLRER